MKDYTPTNPDEESPELAAQRRSLDAMSAALTHNLHKMIAEQERRVREFAALQPADSSPADDMPNRLPTRQQHPAAPVAPVRPKPPTPRSAAETAARQQAANSAPNQQDPVPLPPVPKKKKPVQTPSAYPQPIPGPWRNPEQKKDGQIGPGCIITLIVAVLIMLRACS